MIRAKRLVWKRTADASHVEAAPFDDRATFQIAQLSEGRWVAVLDYRDWCDGVGPGLHESLDAAKAACQAHADALAREIAEVDQ